MQRNASRPCKQCSDTPESGSSLPSSCAPLGLCSNLRWYGVTAGAPLGMCSNLRWYGVTAGGGNNELADPAWLGGHAQGVANRLACTDQDSVCSGAVPCCALHSLMLVCRCMQVEGTMAWEIRRGWGGMHRVGHSCPDQGLTCPAVVHHLPRHVLDLQVWCGVVAGGGHDGLGDASWLGGHAQGVAKYLYPPRSIHDLGGCVPHMAQHAL